jgi:NADH:ubiquinone oxidoreductase subunit C
MRATNTLYISYLNKPVPHKRIIALRDCRLSLPHREDLSKNQNDITKPLTEFRAARALLIKRLFWVRLLRLPRSRLISCRNSYYQHFLLAESRLVSPTKLTWYSKKFASALQKILSKLVNEVSVRTYDLEIKTSRNNLRSLLFFLNKHTLCQYKQLIEISVYDYVGKKYRFNLTYVLLSLKYNSRILVTIKTDEVTPISSVTNLFNSAGWLEREVWDLYGIFFTEHQDLRRILTDYGFSGHPFRKDFPLTGFIEIYYNDEQKRIVYEPVELAQEYRVFTLHNPWTTK